jgi:hypothetical protein
MTESRGNIMICFFCLFLKIALGILNSRSLLIKISERQDNNILIKLMIICLQHSFLRTEKQRGNRREVEINVVNPDLLFSFSIHLKIAVC